MGAIEVAMTALSSTMKEGKIVAWSKNVGVDIVEQIKSYSNNSSITSPSPYEFVENK